VGKIDLIPLLLTYLFLPTHPPTGAPLLNFKERQREAKLPNILGGVLEGRSLSYKILSPSLTREGDKGGGLLSKYQKRVSSII
jgi:hypothetical protein